MAQMKYYHFPEYANTYLPYGKCLEIALKLLSIFFNENG